ncbi:MAG: T9SS type A sorting domain-containing protein [Bacteroidales bacterium]
MKTNRILIVGVIAFELALPHLKAQNLYVMEGNTSHHCIAISRISKINFSENSIQIISDTGIIHKSNLSQTEYLSFIDYTNIVTKTTPNIYQNNGLTVFQNHSTNTLFINFDGELAGNLMIEISNIQGHVLKKYKLQNNLTKIEINKLNTGIYICNLTNNNCVICTKKFIITKK